MRQSFAYLAITVVLTLAPLIFTTGCVMRPAQESANHYAQDQELAARIKTQLYGDPVAKCTQVEVVVFNGVVQLSGTIESQRAKDRAGEIASNTRGVTQVYNNLLLPTGRLSEPVE